MTGDIEKWLTELDLGKYLEAFVENEVGIRDLPHITEADLRELGLPLGPRRRVLAAIEQITADTLNETNGLQPLTPGRTPQRLNQTAERRQVTVVFIDLVGSTAMSGQLDPEDLAVVMRQYHGTCTEIIVSLGGHVAKYMGDGILVYFGWPQAGEDDAENAVRAGLQMVAAVGDLGEPGGGRLTARIGIATGLVVIGDLMGDDEARERSVVGETPNLAARLQSLAEPSTVVISETTRRLLGASITVADLGLQDLKGIANPVRAYVVTGEVRTGSRFDARSGGALTPMAGRDQELALVLERWSIAARGEGQGVLQVGEAGIGKSRITRAVLDAVAGGQHRLIRYQCSPYHTGSALWPAAQQLIGAAGITSEASGDENLDRLEAYLSDAISDPSQVMPLIANLAGLSAEGRFGSLAAAPQVQRAQTLRALVAVLLGFAAHRPVLLVVEDVHWIDPTTQELIELYLDGITASPVLILMTSRPEGLPDLPARPHLTRLTLNRLARAGVESIIDGIPGGDALPAQVVQTIVDRADGVPLFVEELTKAVIEAGDTNIPMSLHDSLMARLDRLSDVREIAQIAACIGREFDWKLLVSIVNLPEAEIAAALEKLTRAELIFRHGTPPDANYTFKHALVRDAAYESLLRSRRREIHLSILAELRRIGTAGPEILAVHAVGSRMLVPAIGYWREAAAAAAARSAYREAGSRYRTALDLIDQVPDPSVLRAEAIDIRLELRNCMTPLGEPERALEFVQEAADLAEELGDVQRQARANSYLCNLSWHTGKPQEAATFGGMAIAAASRAGVVDLQVSSDFFLAQVHQVLGNFRDAGRLYESVIATCDESDRLAQFGMPFVPASHARAWLAMVLADLGEFDAALRFGSEAIAISEASNNPFSLQQACWGLGSVYLRQGDVDQSGRNLERAMEITREWSLNIWESAVASSLGAFKVMSGDIVGGIELLETAVRNTEEKRTSSAWLVPSLIMLAEGFLAANRDEDAATTVNRAMSLARRRGQAGDEVSGYILLGRITLTTGSPGADKAAAHFQNAISRARDLGMRPAVLHASLGLARVRETRGTGDITSNAVGQIAEEFRALGMPFWASDAEISSID